MADLSGGGGTPKDHTNPTYDSDENGTVDYAADADTVDGSHASDLAATLTAGPPNNVASNRSGDTQYTNNTGNPILVSITVSSSVSDDDFGHYLNVAGQRVADEHRIPSSGGNYDPQIVLTGIVPDGETYGVYYGYPSTGTVEWWIEQELYNS